jgi:hypothetical protein
VVRASGFPAVESGLVAWPGGDRRTRERASDSANLDTQATLEVDAGFWRAALAPARIVSWAPAGQAAWCRIVTRYSRERK